MSKVTPALFILINLVAELSSQVLPLTQSLQRTLVLKSKGKFDSASAGGVVPNDISIETFGTLERDLYLEVGTSMNWDVTVDVIASGRGTSKDEYLIDFYEHNLGHRSRNVSDLLKFRKTSVRVPSPAFGALVTCDGRNAKDFALLASMALRRVMDRLPGFPAAQCFRKIRKGYLTLPQKKHGCELLAADELGPLIIQNIFDIINHPTSRSLFNIDPAVNPQCHLQYFSRDPNSPRTFGLVRGNGRLAHLSFSREKNGSLISSPSLIQWMGGQFDLRRSSVIRALIDSDVFEVERIDETEERDVIRIKYKRKEGRAGDRQLRFDDFIIRWKRIRHSKDLSIFHVDLDDHEILDVISDIKLLEIFNKISTPLETKINTRLRTGAKLSRNVVILISPGLIRSVFESEWVKLSLGDLIGRDDSTESEHLTDGGLNLTDDSLDKAFDTWKTSRATQSEKLEKLLDDKFERVEVNMQRELERILALDLKAQRSYLQRLLKLHRHRHPGQFDAGTILVSVGIFRNWDI